MAERDSESLLRRYLDGPEKANSIKEFAAGQDPPYRYIEHKSYEPTMIQIHVKADGSVRWGWTTESVIPEGVAKEGEVVLILVPLAAQIGPSRSAKEDPPLPGFGGF